MEEKIFKFVENYILLNLLTYNLLLPSTINYNFIEDPEDFNTSLMPFSTNLFSNIIVLYEKYLSENKCQFVPSCSRYCYISIEEKGYVLGSILAFSRFSRCNEYAHNYYPYYKGFLFDLPVGINVAESLHFSLNKNINREDIIKIDNDYGNWLINNEQFTEAYSYYLQEEFQNQS